MDYEDIYSPKKLLNSMNMIENYLAPYEKIINENQDRFEKINRIINIGTNLPSNNYINSSVINSLLDKNNNFIDSMSPAIKSLESLSNLTSVNTAYKIANTIPNLYLSEIDQVLNSVLQPKNLVDFRVNILVQEISSTISNLTENAFNTVDIEGNDKFIYFEEPFLKSYVDTKDHDSNTDEIAEVKKLFREIYEYQRENASKNDIQKKEQSAEPQDSAQNKLLAFVNSFLLIVGLISAPKELYEFFVWIYSLLN
ncbi:hypothetical protein [Enterococcus mundtii]|uniref:hypothetical protein n=1 Tax=Enterococcus mundtii TaxID=53346 RepID=UPI0010BE3A54|nr:hypothetical protein [Enterococcus mundtii]QCJ56110.1 hypothetical protein DDJ96_05595 [Enterococcus mundtii]